MPLTVVDREIAFDGTNTPRPTRGPRAVVTAQPTLTPLWIQTAGGASEEDQGGLRSVAVDAATGAWSLVLPWPSVCTPSTAHFTLTRSSGVVLGGLVPEGVAGPLSCWDLLHTYGWGVVSTPTPPAQLLMVDAGGTLVLAGGLSFVPSTQTTAPSAGGAGALPATPRGYATVVIAGQSRLVAFY